MFTKFKILIIVGCLKITEDKALDADLTKRKGYFQLRHESQVRSENESQPEHRCHHTENVRVTFKA